MTTRDRLFALDAFGIKLGLDNMRVLVAALGHPQRAYHTVHVAGTNGKGSVSAFVERALRAAGHRTGLYTSPHLDRVEERVALDGEAVDADRFDTAAARVFDVVDAARTDLRLPVSPTFFEVTTAIAFEAFRAAGVEVAVIEVGLGGRFDATNVVEPRASAITSIALDHQRQLGSTIAQIAAEKAGIAKAGVPLLVGHVPAEALEVIEKAARAAGAPLRSVGEAAELIELREGRARIRARASRWPELSPLLLSLLGRHQVDNAATAIGLLDVLEEGGLAIGGAAVATGLTTARWPARLEWLQLDEGALLIDAAHNPAGAQALASYLQDLGAGPLPIVLAAMQDKDLDGMVRPLATLASRFVATGVGTARAFPPDLLAARIAAVLPGAQVSAVADPRQAVTAALAGSHRAVAAGSIYFVGPLRARLIASGAIAI